MKTLIKKNKFRLYFCGLMAFLLIGPFKIFHFWEEVIAWLLLIGLVYSPYFMSGRKKPFIISTVFLAYLVFSDLVLGDNYSAGATGIVNSIILLGLYFGLIIYVLSYTFYHEVGNEDLIFSGLTGFFLLGLGFSFIYEIFQDLNLVSLNTADGKAGILPSGDLIYFSLSCLSTLGLGDIVPTSPLGKRLAVIESSIGALYVAVFIGRLVGLHSAYGRKGKVAVENKKDN